MKILGIDFGSKRVGVAISDESLKMAFPLSVLDNNEKLLDRMQEIINKEEVSKIVIGESKNFSGQPNEIMKKIEKFVELLEKETSLEIVLEPEFLSSHQAEYFQPRRPDHTNQGSGSRPSRREVKNEMLDASAAAIILQSYLDRK